MTPKQLKKVRKAFNMTYSELSKLVGLSSSGLNYMELGKRPIPENMAKILEYALKKKLYKLKIVVDNLST